MTFWVLTTTSNFINTKLLLGFWYVVLKGWMSGNILPSFFPIVQEKASSCWREGLLVFSECQFSSPVIFVSAPFNTRRNKWLHSVSVYSIAKTWGWICTEFRADIRTFSLIFIKHHSETCLASGFAVILKLMLDLLDVVTEVHIS